MKSIKILFALFSLVLFSTACENYSDTSVEYSSIFPLSGEWRVRVKELGPDTLLKTAAGAVAMYTFSIYNTSDNRVDSMWIRTTSSMVSSLGALRGKIFCDISGLNFSGTDITDISVTASVQKFTITEGKVALNAIDMPSKAKADKISFHYTSTKTGGRNFLIEGFRRTLWNEDETYSGF
jgi:hypothetical protein